MAVVVVVVVFTILNLINGCTTLCEKTWIEKNPAIQPSSDAHGPVRIWALVSCF